MICYLGQRLVDFSLTLSPVNFIDTEVHVMEIVEDFQNYEHNAVPFVNKGAVADTGFPQGVPNPTRGAPNLLFIVADPGFSRGRQLPMWVCLPIILQISCRKLHGNERI